MVNWLLMVLDDHDFFVFVFVLGRGKDEVVKRPEVKCELERIPLFVPKCELSIITLMI